jgi:hypothetical protein
MEAEVTGDRGSDDMAVGAAPKVQELSGLASRRRPGWIEVQIKISRGREREPSAVIAASEGKMGEME